MPYQFEKSKPDRNRALMIPRINWKTIPDKFVVFDLETTGFFRSDTDLLEIGAILVEKASLRKGLAQKTFSAIVNPWRGKGVTKDSIKANGITQKMISSEGIESHIAMIRFLKFAGKNLLVAHNVSFDKLFLEREIKDHGLNREFEYECTLKLSRQAFPLLKSHKLTDMHLLLGNEDFGTHRALPDAKTALNVYLKTKSIVAT